MSDFWVTFLVGLVGVPVVVVGITGVALAWGQGDPLGPARRRSRRLGCRCPWLRNWGGYREAITGACTIALSCPLSEHGQDRCDRMYNSGI